MAVSKRPRLAEAFAYVTYEDLRVNQDYDLGNELFVRFSESSGSAVVFTIKQAGSEIDLQRHPFLNYDSVKISVYSFKGEQIIFTIKDHKGLSIYGFSMSENKIFSMMAMPSSPHQHQMDSIRIHSLPDGKIIVMVETTHPDAFYFQLFNINNLQQPLRYSQIYYYDDKNNPLKKEIGKVINVFPLNITFNNGIYFIQYEKGVMVVNHEYFHELFFQHFTKPLEDVSLLEEKEESTVRFRLGSDYYEFKAQGLDSILIRHVTNKLAQIDRGLTFFPAVINELISSYADEESNQSFSLWLEDHHTYNPVHLLPELLPQQSCKKAGPVI